MKKYKIQLCKFKFKFKFKLIVKKELYTKYQNKIEFKPKKANSFHPS